ncbi:DUF2247 family protein [Pseudomonas syringae]|uniref:DUF2247 family protein n=1 Tax=Pseudomonas syringae TaxID=317 RepID=UPI0009B46FAC|nr:DUF2247 family protein [Pseudomonas syringae]MEE1994825.1 DUF2247 family protein [Pseudomonas syringae pv. syringae]MEE1999784.1 DUF2247 family protein [Pseudomonas syringae pv. syringae]
MIQAVFERITKYGLTDWAVLLQGVCGVPSLLGRLPTSCVEDFAIAELEKVAGNNPLLDVIVSLANDSDLPLSELCPQLKKMSDFQNAEMQRAKRIWRAVALEELLENLDSDPLYGLIKLSDFWSSWDWPVDAPLSMIPGAMTLPQHQYHSESNYDHVVHEHEKWVKDELVALRCRNAST